MHCQTSCSSKYLDPIESESGHHKHIFLQADLVSCFVAQSAHLLHSIFFLHTGLQDNFRSTINVSSLCEALLCVSWVKPHSF